MDWAHVFAASPIAQLLLDEQGSVLEANAAAERWLGGSRPLVGRLSAGLFGPGLRRCWTETLQQLQRDQEVVSVRGTLVEERLADRIVELVLSPVRTGAATAALTIHDVTERDQDAARSARLDRLHHGHREALGALAAAVRPRPLPPLPLDLGVAGRVADPVAPLGGDLHDLQVLADGTLHLSVVDATGHGQGALRHALTMRDAARILALDGCGIDVLVAHLDRVCRSQEDGVLGTALLVRYDPRDGAYAVVRAGHPPALHVAASGRVHERGAPGPPVGVEGARPRAQRGRLGVGELLVLHTDGVTDPRSTAQDPSGRAQLERDLARLRAAEGHTAGDLAHGLLPARTSDDVLVVVLQRSDQPPRRRRDRRGTDTFRTRIRDPRPADITDVRLAISDWLAARSTAPDLSRRALLVVAELATNAVAAADQHLDVEVVASRPGALRVVVQDDGPGFDLEMALSRLEDGGYGLRMVERLCDDLHVATGPQGTVTRAELHTEPASARGGPRR